MSLKTLDQVEVEAGIEIPDAGKQNRVKQQGYKEREVS